MFRRSKALPVFMLAPQGQCPGSCIGLVVIFLNDLPDSLAHLRPHVWLPVDNPGSRRARYSCQFRDLFQCQCHGAPWVLGWERFHIVPHCTVFNKELLGEKEGTDGHLVEDCKNGACAHALGKACWPRAKDGRRRCGRSPPPFLATEDAVTRALLD